MQVSNTRRLNIIPFVFSEEWLYYPNIDVGYRYILGTRGNRPIIVIGLNPSTATPERPDPTIKRVMAIAKRNGYDSFIMLNLYAQRATQPEDLDEDCNCVLHTENLKALRWALAYTKKQYPNDVVPVWCAWGNLVERRRYLARCWNDMLDVLHAEQNELLCISITKAGHPIHPLYQKNSSQLIKWELLSPIDPKTPHEERC